MGIADRRIEDSNLVQAMEKLTPQKIRAAFDAVVKAEAGARLKAYYDSCMRCGMCAQACHFSLSHPDDPSYTPIAKKDQTMWRLIRTDGNVPPEEAGKDLAHLLFYPNVEGKRVVPAKTRKGR